MSSKANMNYSHTCEGKKATLEQATNSLSGCGFTLREFSAIIDFYVIHTPIKKDSNEDKGNQRRLGDYGWQGNAGLQNLERELLRSSHMPSFIIMKSNSIKDTVKQVGLEADKNQPICIEHPRAVMMINKSVSFLEDGNIHVTPTETRMACLFRHVRNAIAHGEVYRFENNAILFQDFVDKTLTASIFINSATLVDWIFIVDKNRKYYQKP